MIQVAKHALIGFLRCYTDDQELQNLKIHHIFVEQQSDAWPCTPPSAKFVCCPAEVNTHRKINFSNTPQCSETQEVLDKLCEEYR